MNWRRALIGAVVALAIVSLLAYGLTQDPKTIESPLPGKEAPNFALAKMDGGDSVNLAKLRGSIVVLNFWASWCLACRDEHTALSEAALAYQGKGVHFFGVLYQDTPENGRQWIQMMGGQSYPTLLDPGLRTAIDFGLYGVPETYFIDANGMIAEKKIGPVTPGYLTEVLDRMLAARAGKPS